MPNWCSNSVRLNFKNASKKMKKRFAALKEVVMLGSNEPAIMGTLYPMPEELVGGRAYEAFRRAFDAAKTPLPPLADPAAAIP